MVSVNVVRDRHDLKRVREILTVFLELGFGYSISKMHLSHYLPIGKRLRAKFQVMEDRPLPERLRLAFERLGSAFIKLGQLLSIRPDLVPIEYIREFEKMQDKVPSFSYSEVEKIIERELGKPIKEIFKSFEATPVAAASIGQVHRAILKNGAVVAVKVQRPNVDELIFRDTRIMLRLADLLERRVDELKDFPLKDIVEEFRHYTLKELNYNIEATNAETFRKNLAGSKSVRVPKIYRDLSTQKVLTMEFMDGIPINQVNAIEKLGISYKGVIDSAYASLVTQIFDHGFFHGDPHPANILVLKKTKQLAFVDFGIMGRFDEGLKNKSIALLCAILDNDSERLVQAMLSMGVIDEHTINKERFRQDVQEIMEQMQGTSLQDIQVSSVLEQIMEIGLRHKVVFPLSFVLFAKTFITLEGIGLRYNPEFKLVEQTKPLIKKIIAKKYSPKAIAKHISKTAMQYEELLEELPLKTTEALNRISQGKLDLDISKTDLGSITYEMEQSVGNLAIGIIIAALIMSASIIYQMETTFKYKGIPVLSIIGLVIAAMLMMWMIKRTVFMKEKRW